MGASQFPHPFLFSLRRRLRQRKAPVFFDLLLLLLLSLGKPYFSLRSLRSALRSPPLTLLETSGSTYHVFGCFISTDLWCGSEGQPNRLLVLSLPNLSPVHISTLSLRFNVLLATGKTLNMKKNEDSGSPSWGASFFMQTTEDVARAVAAAAAARSPQPTMVFSSKDDNGNSPLQKLQHHVSRVLKGFSQTPEVQNGTYNPEVLTSQKRQWASFQL